MTLDPRHVRVFREVVRTGSFTGAAKELGYSQPAISQQMRSLERSLRTPLFLRTQRKLRLTEAGETLLRHAQPILDGLAIAEAEVRAITELQKGTVRIASFPSASATLIPQTISAIFAKHPDVRIELIEAEPEAAFELLRAAECDIALTFSYAEETSDDLLEVPLLSDRLTVLVPDGDTFADRESVSLGELAEARWIAGCPQCSTHFIEACNAAGFEPDIVCSTDDNLSVQSLVAAGLGLSLMPGLVVSFMQHVDLASVSLVPPLTRTVSAYTWPGLAGVPAIRLALEALQAAARERALRTTVA